MTKYRTLISGIVIIVCTWLAETGGIFELPDSLIYDYCIRLIPKKKTGVGRILLVEAVPPAAMQGDETWLNLLRSLEALKPAKVMFTFVPRQATSEFFEAAETFGNVLFARRLRPAFRNPDDPEAVYASGMRENGKTSPDPLPESAEGKHLNFGFMAEPPAYHGIHRHQYAWLKSGGTHLPGFEFAALEPEDRDLPGISPEAPLFRVSFRRKNSGIPIISLDRALAGDLVSELVKGKYVMVGFRKSLYETGIHTPVSEMYGLSLLYFHGFALDTLLSREIIRHASAKIRLALICGAVLLVFVLYAFLSVRLLTWFVLPVCLFLFGAGGFIFTRYSILLPASGTLTAFFLAVLFIIRTQTVQQDQNIRGILFRVSMKLRDSIIPESFYDADDPWTYIITMISQTLNLSRTILLEPVRGDHRVKEIRALHCSLADIHERRRDYRRDPYKKAIRDNTMIPLDRRLFFTDSPPDEMQYLVPLTFAGRILGFWAFGVTASTAEEIRNFNTVISDFGGRIGELLYRREYRHRQSRTRFGKFLDYLLLASLQTVSRDLNNALTLLDRRLTLLNTAFDSTGSAVVMYDHFGQILHMNRRMNAVMKKAGFLPYRMTAADFTEKVTAVSRKEVRHLLRTFLFDRKKISLPAALPSEPDRFFLMNISTLFHEKENALNEFAYPFRTYGILMELVEVTELRMSGRLKDDLLNDLNRRFRKDFGAVLLAASLISRKDLPEGKDWRVSEILHRRVTGMTDYLEEAGERLDRDDFMDQNRDYPIDPGRALNQAVEQVSVDAKRRNVRIHTDAPEAAGLVRADYEALSDIFSAVMILLIEDAEEYSTVLADIIQTDREYIIQFSNTGFGMPDHLFKGRLFEKTEAASPPFKRLQSAAEELEQWGGSFSASSEMGAGTRFTLHLAVVASRMRNDRRGRNRDERESLHGCSEFAEEGGNETSGTEQKHSDY